MRKLIALFLATLLIVAGCSAQTEKDAIATGQQFKQMQYEIKDFSQLGDDYAQNLTERLKPFLTEAKYQKFAANREAGIASFYAKDHKTNIEVKNISFEKYGEDKQKGTVDFNYRMEFQLSGGVNKIVTKTGQMTLVKQGDKWIIERDADQKLQPTDFN